MRDKWQQILEQELKQAGAKTSEISELVPIAANLKRLKVSNTGTRTQPDARRGWLRYLKPATLATSGVVLGMAIVMISQSVSPTSWLYPVQKASDSLAIAVHPQYRATVMMRRAYQVNQLVAGHAQPSIVLAALASYSHEASAYKSMGNSNYAAFEYCRLNLQQAAALAPDSLRRTINNSLSSLNSS